MKSNSKIDEVRMANYSFTNQCVNFINVLVRENESKKPVAMHLNAGGFVKALRENIVIDAEKPSEKQVEMFLAHLGRIKFTADEIDEILAKIVKFIGEEYREKVKKVIES